MNLILSILTGLAFSLETSPSYIVTIHNDKVRVVSPKRAQTTTTLILKNESLRRFIGKVLDSDNKLIEHVAVSENSTVSVRLPSNKQRFRFVPLSPPLQEIELKPGQVPYEIPAKD